jgi:hypothetical protein
MLANVAIEHRIDTIIGNARLLRLSYHCPN